MTDMPTPSIPEPSICDRLNFLWELDKPLFVTIMVGITLFFMAIVFCVAFFLIINPS